MANWPSKAGNLPDTLFKWGWYAEKGEIFYLIINVGHHGLIRLVGGAFIMGKSSLIFNRVKRQCLYIALTNHASAQPSGEELVQPHLYATIFTATGAIKRGHRIKFAITSGGFWIDTVACQLPSYRHGSQFR